mmetsp:Transcript_17291/g.28909  ORF Transcript_17291/g.28909 Transcript_17291/m.28909 type:complete len:359 (-) Transcript_17291:429-1505(-)
MDRRSSKHKRSSNKGKDFAKVLSVLRKLEHVFKVDYHLMLQCSEFLIKECTQSSSPNPTSVSKWVQRCADIAISSSEARALLSYVSLQLAKNHNMKHCTLLPPIKEEKQLWYNNLREISEQTSGGCTFKEAPKGDHIQVFPVEQHKLKKLKTTTRVDARTTRLRAAEDPTLHMFPALPSATPSHAVHQPKSILKAPREPQPVMNRGGGDDSNNIEYSPIKFKKTSTSMAYRKYGSFGGLDGTDRVSVADMVALAKKKQQGERLQRQFEEEMNCGKSSIDYGLIQRKDSRVLTGPKKRELSYNDHVDKELFSTARALDSPKSKMAKAKQRFRKDSARVTDEVYEILGVRADTTLRRRKY